MRSLVLLVVALARMADGVPQLPIPLPGACAIVCSADDTSDEVGDDSPEAR
jgi:hypothetical protein